MLTALRISGLAVVEHADVRFAPGLNVITGETGAGKSILLHALHLALGGRMSVEMFRDGVDEVTVEALFELAPGHPAISRAVAAGLPASSDESELLVRRTATRSGRSKVFVNGALCTVAMLERCVRGLVDITGQHEHVTLLHEATHLPLLDALAGTSAGADALLPRYRAAWAALAASIRERERLVAARDESARRSDDLRAQLAEIDKAGPKTGEDLELERERQVLASAEKLRNVARFAEGLVYAEEDSAAERIGRAVRGIMEGAVLDARLGPTLVSLRSGLAEVEEAGRSLARYADALEGDPERLAEVEERLTVLKRLARKHGGSIDAVLARAVEFRGELARLEDVGARLADLDAEIEAAAGRTVDLAQQLTSARAHAAAELPAAVQRDLGAVAMAHCRLEVEMLPPENPLLHGGIALGPDGAEGARLLFAPNAGEAARPLARIASGGELSRIILALKRALARIDPVDTYVFDEVDAGIGGGVAEAVGRLLAAVSNDRQVLCVTHLPQVAAFADRHFRVEKHVRGGRTLTAVAALEAPEERRAEVARMLAGADLTESAVRHARALIACARSTRGDPGSRVRARIPPLRTAARTARVNALTRQVRG